MKHHLLCLSVSMVWPSFASAEPFLQLFDKLNLAGFSASATDAFTDEIDLRVGGQFRVFSRSFSIAQEIPTGEANGFSIGLTYDHIDIDQQAPNARTPLPDRLQSLSLDVSYQHQLSERWSLLTALSPRLANAGSSLNSDGFGASGAIIATWAYRPNLSFSFGGGYDVLNGASQTAPVVGFNWTVNSRWQVLVGYPTTAVVYTPSERWSFAVIGEGTGGTYYVEKDPAPGAPGRSSLDDSTLTYEDGRVGLAGSYQVSEAVTLMATVGYLLLGQFEYESPKYKVKTDGGAPYGSFAVDVAF